MAAVTLDLSLPPTRVTEPVRALLSASARTILEASVLSDPALRYVTAHLGALRAAAAVLAARATPDPRRSRVRSTWLLLPRVAPELGEWATYFAASATIRAAVDAGTRTVPDRLADDLVRDAESFLAAVCAVLDVPHQPLHR